MWRAHLRAASTLVSRLGAAPQRIAARHKRRRMSIPAPRESKPEIEADGDQPRPPSLRQQLVVHGGDDQQ
jgi:hypothetical protein